MSCSGCSYKGMSTAVEDGFVGVRFREETNNTLCSTSGTIFGRGEEVVVDLDSGPAFGHVEQSPMPVFKPCQKAGAKRILRKATPADRTRSRPPALERAAGQALLPAEVRAISGSR